MAVLHPGAVRFVKRMFWLARHQRQVTAVSKTNQISLSNFYVSGHSVLARAAHAILGAPKSPSKAGARRGGADTRRGS
jgi:hypothetical protein